MRSFLCVVRVKQGSSALGMVLTPQFLGLIGKYMVSTSNFELCTREQVVSNVIRRKKPDSKKPPFLDPTALCRLYCQLGPSGMVWGVRLSRQQCVVSSMVAQSGKKLPQCRTPEFNPWVRKIPWRRKWQSTPVFLSGEPHEQRSLGGYSPWGCKKSDMT